MGVLGLLILLLTAGWLYQNKRTEKKGILTLHTTPERVALKIDGQSLQQGRYVITPVHLSLTLGSHMIEISRPGYATEPQTLHIEEAAMKKEVMLREQKAMAPLRIRISSTDTKAFYLVVDSGLEASALSSQHYWDVIGIPFGEKHILEIYSDETKTELLAECTFTPRAQSWQAPFVVEADIEKKRCSYPLY